MIPSSIASPLLGLSDRFTLIATSALAYVVAFGLHEHLGHSAACVLLNGHVPLDREAVPALH